MSATSRHSSALQSPNTIATASGVPKPTLAATVASSTAVQTRTHAVVPSAMSAPAANPEAGQNTAMLSGCTRSTKLSRAAR